MTDADTAMLAARRDLVDRMSRADNLEDCADMLTTAILESGGNLTLPTLADQVAGRHIVEVQVHGLAATAPTIEQAAETWLEHAAISIVDDVAA